MSEDEVVRRCSYAVAVLTGVDPFAHRHILKGDDELQKARKLWAQFVAVDMGIPVTQAARVLARSRETIIINLQEIQDWRDHELHPRGRMFDEAMENVSEAIRLMLHGADQLANAAPSPVERSRMNRRAAEAF